MPFPSRKRRACNECHKSKTRCSLSSPCSRCRTRKLKCEYVHNILNRYGINSQSQDASTSSVIENSDSHPTLFSGNTFDASIFDEISNGDISTSIVPQAEPALACTPFLGELAPLGVENLSQQLMIPPNITSKDIFIDNYCQLAVDLAGGANRFSWLNSQAQVGCDPSSGTETSQPKAPVSQKWEKIQTELTRKVLVGQLLTYPKMMNSNRLPPFIFAPCKQGDGCGLNGSHQCLLQPLAHCCAIVTMAENITVLNMSFIWAIVENEVQRLCQELPSYNSYEVLESLQACVIYVLLYTCYVKPFQVGSIVSVIIAIKDISIHLHTIYNMQAQLSADESIFRQEWTLRESARRTVCVLYGVELLLDVFEQDPNHEKCRGMKNVPLPCTRDLWEPVSDSKWARRYQNSISLQLGNETLSIGTIQSSLFLKGRNLETELRQDASVEAISYWCERADELGTLVWMALMLEMR